MFKNMKTAQKITVLVAISLIAMGVVGYLGISGMAKLAGHIGMLNEKHVMGNYHLGNIQTAFLQIRMEIRTIRSATTLAAVDDSLKIVDEQEKALLQSIDAALPTMTTQEGRDGIAEAKSWWDKYKKEIQDVRNAYVAGDLAGAITASKDDILREAAAGLDAAIVTVKDTKITMSEEMYAAAMDSYEQARNTGLIVIGLALLLCLFIGTSIARAIAGPLALALRQANQVAAGDLTSQVEYVAKDEVGLLVRALNEAVDGMKQLVTKVRDAAATISSSSQQLAATAEEMAAGSQNQANEIGKASQTINEFAASVQQVAGSAQEVSSQSEGAAKVAQEGGQAVNKAISGMDVIQKSVAKLGEHSEQIGQIVQVIDDIASQTNLLALNAAIEAARAGEHGRGFAVVADEVRKLAERSGQATKEITGLIKEIQRGTEAAVGAADAGVGIIKDTGEKLMLVVDGAQKTAASIEEISAASEEQAASSSEVSKMIETIASVTEEVSAGAEETSASTQELARMADELSNLIAQFKL